MAIPTTMVRTRYSETVADVSREIGQRAWNEKQLSRLERRVKQLKLVLAETFHEHCDSSL